jgi:Na+/alanine symporter
MTQLRFSRSAIRWIAVIGVASLLTAAGAWGEYLALHSMRQTLGNSSVLLLLTPGYILAGILAALFASGGIHSIGEFTWLGVPVSWIFYFAVGALIFCVRRKDDATQTQAGGKPSRAAPE